METLNVMSAITSLIGVLLIVIVLPNVIGQLLLKNSKDEGNETANNFYPSRTQGIMSLGIIFLMIGRFGASVANNNLDSSHLVYGIVLTILTSLFIVFISLKPSIINRQTKERVSGALYSSIVLLIGLIVMLLNHFVIGSGY